MIRAIQADEGLGVARRLEDDPGIVDSHHLVIRRVDDQQGSAQRGDALALWPHADLAQIAHLSGVGWHRQGHHGAYLGHPGGDRQDRGPAE